MNATYTARRKRLAGPGFASPRIPGSKGFLKLAALGVALIIALGIIVPVVGGYFDGKEVTTVVNSHERVCDSGTDGDITCRYLVFTDAGTFELTDSLYLGRFNSSDTYGRIKDGQMYHISYYGWRFGCTSTYPNIKSLEPTVGN